MNIEEEYKEQIGNIHFRQDFETESAVMMRKAAKKKGEYAMFRKKPLRTVLIAVLIIVIFSIATFAVTSLLPAKDVAQKLGENYAADALGEKNDEVLSITDKGYTVSFLGQAEGEKLMNVDGINTNCSYFVVSIAKEDGTPLSLIDGNPLGMSIIIEGCPAWKINSWSLDSSATGYEENGVLYYLYECASLEIFANRKVFLAVYEGFVPHPGIITMNSDGTFDFASEYSGFEAMFKLPLDPEKANHEVAEEIINRHLNTES